MSFAVAVGEFEGPLGLLLELVEKNQLEVTAISIGRITSDYLGRVRAKDSSTPEDLSDFISLGARLLYIKSLALLPGDTPVEQSQELRQLKRELETYKAFQQAAKQLAESTGSTRPRRAARRAATPTIPNNLKLEDLAQAFTAALKLVPAMPTRTLQAPHVTLEAASKKLRTKLSQPFNLQQAIDECANRLEIVVLFLALLELIRAGTAKVVQAGQFGAITVEPTRA